ncbi:SprT-like domain-containing protein [Prevotella sp. KH2C16]|uniref:SprT-like domain-containing protein n=1 Tax=Prevotella sp. KH2C16 TaxID=1855325 RepID=UPI0008E85732|nr:SprT-like domain-containing protein [Prevotella sp. KH2C16]SFG39515.1 SprT-like family protein [Prevotella sp. KH2C16]
MQITLEWMSHWFAKFNADYFGGGLPQPRLALSKSKTRLGSMSCKKRVRLFRTECCDYTIRLSNYYDQTERQYQNVLLHEMIHYSIAYTRLKDTSPHGIVFRGMMENLNRKYGWEISVTTSMKATPRAGGVPKNKTYLVLALETWDGKNFLSVVNPRFAGQLERQIVLVNKIKAHHWLRTKSSYFSDFPAVRSLRAKRVSREVYERFAKDLPLESTL